MIYDHHKQLRNWVRDNDPSLHREIQHLTPLEAINRICQKHKLTVVGEEDFVDLTCRRVLERIQEGR